MTERTEFPAAADRWVLTGNKPNRKLVRYAPSVKDPDVWEGMEYLWEDINGAPFQRQLDELLVRAGQQPETEPAPPQGFHPPEKPFATLMYDLVIALDAMGLDVIPDDRMAEFAEQLHEMGYRK